MHPTARRTDIIVQTLGTEVLVYDQRHDAAHSLNAAAALVYEHADGTRSIDSSAAPRRQPRCAARPCARRDALLELRTPSCSRRPPSVRAA